MVRSILKLVGSVACEGYSGQHYAHMLPFVKHVRPVGLYIFTSLGCRSRPVLAGKWLAAMEPADALAETEQMTAVDMSAALSTMKAHQAADIIQVHAPPHCDVSSVMSCFLVYSCWHVHWHASSAILEGKLLPHACGHDTAVMRGSYPRHAMYVAVEYAPDRRCVLHF